MCAAALFFMMTGGANAMLVALSQGYVVAAPGARGRTTQAADDGTYTGKAPALIVDMKAAVRYLLMQGNCLVIRKKSFLMAPVPAVLYRRSSGRQATVRTMNRI